MAFNRSGNSRDDKSGRSSNRVSKTGDKPKRSASPKGTSSRGSDQTASKAGKKYGTESSGEKRSFSAGGKSYGSGGDKPASSFTGGAGDRKSSGPRSKPYTGRVADNDDRPKRSFGGSSSGDKKSFTPRSKPYSGRVADMDDKPKRSFGSDSSGEKNSFGPRAKSYSGRASEGEDRPKRSFGGDSTGEKKPFSSRPRSASGATGPSDRPKRATAGGASGDRKFGSRPTTSGFKKQEEDRPTRLKPTYDKITKDTDAPAKTLRGRKKGPAEAKETGLIRLNRYISNAGICSRRKADELISAGVVSVNGVVISELGHKVNPQTDEIKYNGETLRREKMVYVLLNKPKDYITTTEDPQERRTVMHLVEKASKERIYPIGRLDRNTTGLLLMTNDGDLADKLSHPKNNITKLYQVELNKSLTQGDLNKIMYGLELEDGLIKPDSVSYVAGGTKREVGIQIHSGKNRIVRRIFEHLGYEVVKLDRSTYANLNKKDLPRGRWRFLEEKEVIQLKHLV